MTDSTQHRVLDFTTPRRPASEALRQLTRWLTNVCAQTQDAWAGLLTQQVRVQPGKIEPVQYHAALQQLPDAAWGVYFSLGEALLPSMLVLSNRQIHALVADLLDLPGDEWPTASALSAAEESMVELLFQKFAEAIGEGWPAALPLKCQFLETTTRPQRTRLFPIGAALFAARIKLNSRFGEETCTWLVLKEETERLLLEHADEGDVQERCDNPDLVERIEKVPMEISVQLGHVELSMSDISALAAGDVLILDQFVNRPLKALVNGQVKWAGSPVRIGSRQGLEVTHVIENSSMLSLPQAAGPDGQPSLET